MNQTHMIAIGLVIFTLSVYMRHRKGEGKYKPAGDYNRSAMYHDFVKQATLDLFPLLIFPITTMEFYNPKNILNSAVGRIFISILGYFIFYQVVEPYILMRLPQL